MENNPKNHHYVPRKGYLEKFANRKNQIFKGKIDIQLAKKLKGFNSAAICYGQDYYKFENKSLLNQYNIDDPLYIEKKVFQSYENHIGVIINKIENRQAFLTIDDCKKLIFTLVDIKFRNPFFRKFDYSKLIDNVIDEMFHDISFITHLTKEFNISIDSAIEYISLTKEKLKNNSSKDLHNLFLLNRHLEETSIHKYLNFLLLNLDWQILCVPTDNQFITSDNPGFCMESGLVYNTKFNGNFTFVYPLSSSMAIQINANNFSLQNEGLKILKYIYVPYDFVHFINLQTAQIANNEIYGANENVVKTVWNSFHRLNN